MLKLAWSLSKAQPELWAHFLETLHVYTNDRMQRAIGAPTSELFISVGIARQALEFSGNMDNLDDLVAKIRKQEEKR